MKKLNSITGYTIIETMVTLTILGIVICPLCTLFIMSAKINRESNVEYKSLLAAQGLIEEIKATDEIDLNTYSFDVKTAAYEKIIALNDELKAKVTIDANENLLYIVNIVVFHNDIEVNSIYGTKLLNK